MSRTPRNVLAMLFAITMWMALAPAQAQEVIEGNANAREIAQELIERSEGFEDEPYLDAGKTLTAGWGHTDATGCGPPIASLPKKITKDIAEAYLACDLDQARGIVARLVVVPLAPESEAALISLVFNIGADQFANSTLLKLINEGRLEAAANQFSRWILCRGKPLPGLVKRRAEERALWLAGLQNTNARIQRASARESMPSGR